MARPYRQRREICRPDCEWQGVVKFFDDARGFGFLIPDLGGADIYFSEAALIDKDRTPLKGERVLFAAGRLKSGRYGATAVEVI
jgi:cold shock CspA family protein